MSTPPQRFCRLLSPGELTECLQWALPRYPLVRASWILSQLTAEVQSGHTSQIVAAVASSGPERPIDRRNLLAAAVAIPQVAGAATLLLLQVVTSRQSDSAPQETNTLSERSSGRSDSMDDGRDMVCQLLDPVLSRLRQRGVTFLQAACDDPDQGELLRKAGFQPLADLALMVLPREQFAETLQLAQPDGGNGEAAGAPLGQWVSLEAVGEDWPEIFSCVATRTFIETRDCPLLSDFRTAEEIVQGYRTASAFDPALSRLLRLDDQWAGCLVLTHHGPSQSETGSSPPATPAAALELTYMGLIPEYRRRRLSASLLAETVRVAEQLQAAQVVLAVDQKNQPATASYRRLGWQDVATESVWGMRIGS